MSWEMKKINYKLEIEIFRKSTLKNLGVLCLFKGLGVHKRHPDALLAKTMGIIIRNIVKVS